LRIADTRAKALSLLTERFRGFENPLPRTKVRGYTTQSIIRPHRRVGKATVAIGLDVFSIIYGPTQGAAEKLDCAKSQLILDCGEAGRTLQDTNTLPAVRRGGSFSGASPAQNAPRRAGVSRRLRSLVYVPKKQSRELKGLATAG
jgi:hypothetical protein